MFDPSLLAKLTEMKSMTDASKQKLDQMTVEGESGSGLIRIVLSGNREVRSVQINAELDQMNKEDLEDLLTVALKRAMEAADQLNQQETMSAARNLFPGM
jgi:DNA-binding YbaB/EbfC family protein